MTSLSFSVCRMSGFPGDSSHHDEVGLQVGAEQEGLRSRRMEVPLLVEPDRARRCAPIRRARRRPCRAPPLRRAHAASASRPPRCRASLCARRAARSRARRPLATHDGRPPLAQHDVADRFAVTLGEEHGRALVLELCALDRLAERRGHVRREVFRRVRLGEGLGEGARRRARRGVDASATAARRIVTGECASELASAQPMTPLSAARACEVRARALNHRTIGSRRA